MLWEAPPTQSGFDPNAQSLPQIYSSAHQFHFCFLLFPIQDTRQALHTKHFSHALLLFLNGELSSLPRFSAPKDGLGQLVGFVQQMKTGVLSLCPDGILCLPA